MPCSSFVHNAIRIFVQPIHWACLVVYTVPKKSESLHKNRACHITGADATVYVRLLFTHIWLRNQTYTVASLSFCRDRLGFHAEI